MDNTKILEILHSLDPDFSDTEKLPPASAEKIRTAFRDAEMALNTFRKTCFNLIGVAQNEPIDGRLAADFRTNVIDSAIDETALKVAEKMNEPPHRVSSGTGNENIIFKIFTDELLSRGSVWENTTKNGDNATFNIVFGEQITHVTGQIRDSKTEIDKYEEVRAKLKHQIDLYHAKQDSAQAEAYTRAEGELKRASEQLERLQAQLPEGGLPDKQALERARKEDD